MTVIPKRPNTLSLNLSQNALYRLQISQTSAQFPPVRHHRSAGQNKPRYEVTKSKFVSKIQHAFRKVNLLQVNRACVFPSAFNLAFLYPFPFPSLISHHLLFFHLPSRNFSLCYSPAFLPFVIAAFVCFLLFVS